MKIEYGFDSYKLGVTFAEMEVLFSSLYEWKLRNNGTAAGANAESMMQTLFNEVVVK